MTQLSLLTTQNPSENLGKKKTKKPKLPNPATQSYFPDASLILEGWNWWDQKLSASQRGQISLYLENMGLEELPEWFKPGTIGYKQAHYNPQQKRGGKIPKEVLPDA